MATNKLYTWGGAANGKLGNGTTSPDVLSPTQIGTDTNWDKISMSGLICLAIKDGALYSWGLNSGGRTGLNTTSGTTNTPTQVGSNTDWTDIFAAGDYSLGIRDGKLYSWGVGSSTALGNGTTTPDLLVPTQVGSDTDWLSVSGGYQHALAIKTSGELWAWGSNGNGQIGDGTTTQRLSPVRIGAETDWDVISAGASVSLAIRGGKLYGWGRRLNFLLGDNSNAGSVSTPTQIGSSTDWTSVSVHTSNSSHVLAVKNGALFVWGTAGSGKLGNGSTTTNLQVPTQIGSDTDWQAVSAGQSHSSAIKAGALFTWGAASNGRLGNGTTTPNVTVPTQVGSNTLWTSISNGDASTSALQSAVTPPSNTAAPAISGTAKVGETLTASDGTWTNSPTSYSYQWQRSSDGVSWHNISGETAATTTLVNNEAGKLIRVEVTATNSAGSATAYSASIGPVAPAIPEEGLIWHSSRVNTTIPTEGLIFWPRIEEE